MASLLHAIRKETTSKHIVTGDPKTMKVYSIFDELFRFEPVTNQELAFEKQLFTRGTGSERVGLHTSAIIASDEKYCVREQVLSLIYKPRNMNSTLGTPILRIFEEGNYVHRKWQRLFLRGGLAQPQDLDVTCFNKKYMLGFSPDAIITIKGRKFIVEIKSMNEFIYKKSNRHPSAEKQLRMYMFLTGINDGIVLMENKNNQEFKLTILESDNSLIVDYIARLEDIKEHYKNKEMPDRIKVCKTKLSKRCTDCPMSDACWATPRERGVMRIGQT